jgi:hypothetical protein
MSLIFFFWLLFILGNLLENTSHFVGCLTLVKESNELERISGHRLVQFHELELICLGLCKEDLFTLLVCSGYFHHLMEVTTLEVAEELYLTLHELMHWRESRFLGSTKPADQLVTNIGEPSDVLKVISDAFIKVCLRTICVIRELLCDNVGPFGQAYVLKTLTHHVKQQWTIIFLSIQKLSQNL